jgi:hypothetical protein
MLAGDAVAARRVATEGLAAARATGAPSAICNNLNALAGAVLDEDPEQARALFREALRVRSDAGYETGVETQQAAVLAARLELWPETIEFAASATRLFHWTEPTQLGASCNLLARALATTDPESAATLQGIAYAFATRPTLSRSEADVTSTQAARQDATRPDGVGIITQIRRATTAMLVASLGEGRLRELRAEGQAMDSDRAVAYALDVAARARHST